MSVILNFKNWKSLYEQAEDDIYQDLNTQKLTPGGAVQVPGWVGLGPIGGVAVTDQTQWKREGNALFKDPVVYMSSNREAGYVMGQHYYTTAESGKNTQNIVAGKVGMVAFKFKQTSYGTTAITRVAEYSDQLNAYSFIAVWLNFLEYTANPTEALPPYYINIIKSFGQLAPGLPNLAQSIIQYNTDRKEKLEVWKNTLALALSNTTLRIYPDVNSAKTFINRSIKELTTIFG
jgi:hypothetical protein